MQLWDEAERNLRMRGLVNPDRRQHSRQGDNGCTRGDVEDCLVCSANARARAEYREALFAEIGRLRHERGDT
ncbi:MAG TPA: hypothetical protein VGP82_01595 [Ktedonobacterales bacterium]|jgi:hypothetical protein|nr:hypothetical protein [Ktedonobacterales bacterium]